MSGSQPRPSKRSRLGQRGWPVSNIPLPSPTHSGDAASDGRSRSTFSFKSPFPSQRSREGPTPANYLADSVVFQTHAVQPEDPVVFTNQCPIPPPASNLGRPNLSEIKSFGPLRPTAVPPTQDEKNKPVINVIEALSDAAWAELKDLSKVITLLDTEAANTFGHFCDLFVGVHSSLQLKVALKRPRISKQGYSEADIKRLIREAETWRSLKHDYILPFVDVGRLDNFVYLVSPFEENGTLKSYLEKNPSADRLRLLYETAEAVAYLHRQGVIHGDIKSYNILVSHDVHALLCDFGLTRFSGDQTSTTLKGAGTIRWQSPELLDGQPKSPESDTWAFGITISQVLSDELPYSQYNQNSQVITAILIRDERPCTKPMFSTTGTPYYSAWRAAVYCWAKAPADRPSMMDIASMLIPIPQPRASTPNPPLNMSYTDSGVPMLPTMTLSGRKDWPKFDPQAVETPKETFCYCGGYGYEDIIICDGSLSPSCLKRFHLDCLGDHATLSVKPWLCLECEAEKIRLGASGAL